MTKPGIAAGVAVAGLAGMSLAAGGMPPACTAAVCLACIVFAAMGSAMMNVVMERDTDSLMPRVAGRLRALGLLGRRNALMLAGALIAASLVLSVFFLAPLTSVLILAASGSYVLLYTLRWKKRSPYGTVTGGIPGALPVLIGYSSIRGDIGLDGTILFLVMLLWQPPHFLPLALKYRGEYESAGTPVMPAVLGEDYTRMFIFIYAAALFPLTLALYLFGYCSAWFGWLSSLLGAAFLGTYYVELVRRRNYGRAFAASIVYMMAVLAALMADIWTSS